MSLRKWLVFGTILVIGIVVSIATIKILPTEFAVTAIIVTAIITGSLTGRIPEGREMLGPFFVTFLLSILVTGFLIMALQEHRLDKYFDVGRMLLLSVSGFVMYHFANFVSYIQCQPEKQVEPNTEVKT